MRKAVLAAPVKLLSVVGLLVVTSTGCQNLNRTENGAILGSGGGALLGAIVGHQSGNAGKGAAIGAAAGALGGGLIGNAQDKQIQRDNAMAHAAHQQQMRRIERNALTNDDVIRMYQGGRGVSENTIIGMIQDQKGRFDMRPNDVILLSQNGIPDSIIQTMRTNNIAGP